MRALHTALTITAILLAGYASTQPVLASPAGATWACSIGDYSSGCASVTLAPLPTARGLLAVAGGLDHRIYTIGGTTNSAPLQTTEAYDIGSGTWIARAPMPTARFGVATTTGLDGRIYVVGGTTGCSTSCVPLTTVEAYDTSSNTWRSLAPMGTARYMPAAATGRNGRIYVMGGYGLSSVEAYDPQTNQWTTVAPMHTVRFAPAAVTGSDGRIYAIGGSAGRSGESDSASVEAYDTRSNTWTVVASMPTRRSALAAALGPDGRIYAVGGTNSATSYVGAVEAYNPTTNTWTAVTSMPTPRFSLGATTGSDGSIYTIGGFSASSGPNVVEAYTPSQALPPGPPASVYAYAQNGTVTVRWLPPTSNGAVVTGYLVNAYAASTGMLFAQLVVAASTTSATFTGLNTGDTYTFTVSAQSTAGLGPESARSNAVTPASVPAAPTYVQATAGSGQVTVGWTSPASDGGSPITGYTVTTYLGSSGTVVNQVSVGAGVTSTTLTGLTRGQTYSFTVTANNALGSSAASGRSNLVTLATVPDAPRSVQAIPMVGGIAVTWTAPADGGSPITRYTVHVSDAATGQSTATSVAGGTSSTTITGLTNGRTYVVTVTAVNALGESASSAPSNPVTLPSVPNAVTNVRVTPGDTSATVTWTAPSSNGGAAVTTYIVTASDGVHAPVSATSTTTSVTLPGLTNDITYTISIVAANAVGQGPAATATVIPRNVPPVLLPATDQSVQYSDDLSFDISATDAESGDHLSLSASGLPSGLSFTDHGNGSATISGSVQAAAGIYPVTIAASDGHNPAVTRTLTITVAPETAVVSLSRTNPSAVVVAGGATTTRSVMLTAVIAESADSRPGDITRAAPVTCTLTGLHSNVTYSRTATVHAGSAQNTLAASCPFSHLPVDEYRIAVTTSGTNYQGSADGMLAVYKMTPKILRATGSLVHGGITGDLTAAARYTPKGRPQGSLRYVEHQSGGDTTLQSGKILAMVVRSGHVYVQGTATVNGAGGYRFVASFVPGTSSLFGLWVTDPTNHTVSSLSFAPAPLTTGQATVSRRR